MKRKQSENKNEADSDRHRAGNHAPRHRKVWLYVILVLSIVCVLSVAGPLALTAYESSANAMASHATLTQQHNEQVVKPDSSQAKAKHDGSSHHAAPAPVKDTPDPPAHAQAKVAKKEHKKHEDPPTADEAFQLQPQYATFNLMRPAVTHMENFANFQLHTK